MKIDIQNNYLQVTASSIEEQPLIEQLKRFQLKLNGSSLEIYNDTELLCLSDLVDNSAFIIGNTKEALEAANLLGAKRFLMSVSEENSKDSILFGRDREFGFQLEMQHSAKYKALVGLKEIKQSIATSTLYKELAALYKNHADFTASKQAEYSAKDVEDKYCRYKNPHVLPILMVNEQNTIMGSIRIFFIQHGDKLTAYLSDEIVKYQQEEERMMLMNELFCLARNTLRQIPNLNKAFIRVASGRATMYEKLGCSQGNTDIRVIHGAPTPLLEKIQGIVKSTAEYKLSLKTESSQVMFKKLGEDKKLPEEEVHHTSPSFQ